MPVAGNTLYSVELNWKHGILSERAWMHRLSSVVEKDPASAVEKLLAGEHVYMYVYGNNVIAVRDALLGRREE